MKIMVTEGFGIFFILSVLRIMIS